MSLLDKLEMVDLTITVQEMGDAIGEIAIQSILMRGARIALEEAKSHANTTVVGSDMECQPVTATYTCDIDKMLKELEA